MNDKKMLNPNFADGYKCGYHDAIKEIAKRLKIKNIDYLEGLNYELPPKSEQENVNSKEAS